MSGFQGFFILRSLIEYVCDLPRYIIDFHSHIPKLDIKAVKYIDAA